MGLFGKSNEKLIAGNEAACQRDDEIMEEYIQGIETGKRVKLTGEQLRAHLQEAATIEETRNELIDRGFNHKQGRWQKG